MIAIITARSGSKRIPNKNIKDFCGKPILAYPILTALESQLFQEVMVSTDSEEIAAVAKAYGASVPFLRSAKNSDDYAGTADVLAEVLTTYAQQGKEFNAGCCIYPTAPLLTSDILKAGLDIFLENNFDVVFPVLKYSYPVQRSLRMSNHNKVTMLWPENYSKRSQDLEAIYHDAGQFYWFKTLYLCESLKLFGENTGGLLIDDMSAQDIDTESDWQLAELKYQSLLKNKLRAI